ncbi:amidase signature domain-containing protein [Aspergillus floccosus]
MTSPDWEQKAQAKQAEAAAKIPSAWRLPSEILDQIAQGTLQNVLEIPRQSGLLSDRELLITEVPDATELLKKLSSREWSAVEVTTAFCKRAAIAQQLTSCLTETFFDIALARAKELDDHLAKSGTPVGPLHGLPISLKDPFNVMGVPTSLGFVSFLDRPPRTSNSALVEILLKAGAVLYVKTNVPQTMMTADSHNNVFGRTLNPYRLNLTAGGSTGGEGALIAQRGSILGVGTDIAGSIRIPALCCGVVGFKPSASRVPYGGQTGAGRPGLAGIAPVAGPLCHSVRDAELFLKVVFNSHPDDLDDAALGITWIEPVVQPVLTIGLLPEDPARPLHPCMQRTLATATKKLQAAGHRIVDLTDKIPSISAAHDTAFRFFNMDPDKTPLSNIARGGEPRVPSLKTTYNPDGEDPEPTLKELYDLNVKRLEVSAKMRKAFLENQLDVILAPGYQSTAVPHDSYGAPMYTVLANLVDYPASVIPFEKANADADAQYIRDVHYVPEYEPSEIEGAPCHVQLIGRRLKDEVLMQHSKVVEAVLKQD